MKKIKARSDWDRYLDLSIHDKEIVWNLVVFSQKELLDVIFWFDRLKQGKALIRFDNKKVGKKIKH
ncbi:MAG TPA: hypothetical protein PKL13_04995 [bacterium]|nr:hypothetical protein [bacterium]